MIVTFIGALYAAWSYREALLDERAVRLRGDQSPVLIALCDGLRVDQFQLTLTQTMLLLAGIVSQLGPVPSTERAWAVVGVFVCLLATSLILAFKSYTQVNRRKMIGALIARQRRG